MASIINASTSGAGGVITTADASGQLELQTAGVTRQTIDVNGNVGIGTSSPSFKFQITAPVVNSGISVAQLITNAGTGQAGSGIGLGYGTGDGYYARLAGVYDNTGSAFTVSTSALGVAAAERMRIDSSGYVTKPFQVAFNAYNASSGNPVLWATANLNIGSAYNTSTGRFTAPITGRYLIYVGCHAGSGLGRADFRLQVNGTDREGGAASQSTTYTQATGIAVLQLNANDYVTVNALATFTNVQALSYFGGYLLG